MYTPKFSPLQAKFCAPESLLDFHSLGGFGSSWSVLTWQLSLAWELLVPALPAPFFTVVLWSILERDCLLSCLNSILLLCNKYFLTLHSWGRWGFSHIEEKNGSPSASRVLLKAGIPPIQPLLEPEPHGEGHVTHVGLLVYLPTIQSESPSGNLFVCSAYITAHLTYGTSAHDSLSLCSGIGGGSWPTTFPFVAKVIKLLEKMTYDSNKLSHWRKPDSPDNGSVWFNHCGKKRLQNWVQLI